MNWKQDSDWEVRIMEGRKELRWLFAKFTCFTYKLIISFCPYLRFFWNMRKEQRQVGGVSVPFNSFPGAKKRNT
jgi:hypothetical protein